MTRLLTAAIMGLTAATAVAAEPAADYPVWNGGIAASFANYSWSNGVVDDNTAGVKIYSGYRFDKLLGIEGAYYNFGEFSDDTAPTQPGGDAKVDISGFSLTGVIYAPIPNPDLDVFARLGYYDFSQDLKVDSVPSQSEHIDGLTAGAGVRLKVSDQIRVRAEGEWFDVDGGDLWTVNLGIEFLFGRQSPPVVAAPAAAPAARPAPAPAAPADGG